MASIVVKNLSKEFTINFMGGQGFLARIVNLFSLNLNKKKIKVFDGTSLQVKSGEILGIIGPNGSGKSTLLRLIAGIYPEHGGTITTEGKIISLINIGVGLKQRLTMRDNIFLVGSLFCLSQKDIKDKFPSIINFTELGGFVDTKLYQFSSGMLQRLAFSIAVHANPEILLLDEVFEVGDEDFKKKSANKIEELSKSGVVVVMVSHDLDMVKKYCPRVVWMEGGRIVEDGIADKVVSRYLGKQAPKQSADILQ